jgi:hypothetical protein
LVEWTVFFCMIVSTGMLETSRIKQ